MSAPAPAAAAAPAPTLARFIVRVEPAPGEPDLAGEAALAAAAELGLATLTRVHSATLYELAGPPGALSAATATRIASALLADPVAERFEVRPAADAAADTAAELSAPGGAASLALTVARRQGVMDPTLLTLEAALQDLGFAHAVTSVRRGRAYWLDGALGEAERDLLVRRALANLVIEEVVPGEALPPWRRLAPPARAAREDVPLGPDGPDGAAALHAVNAARGLALSALELDAIAAHFRALGRDPTTCELETLAQTWSEHCKHKTLGGPVRYEGPPPRDLAAPVTTRTYRSLLKETIFAATRELDRRDLCLSVFVDNAGVIALDETRGVCMKVETHNHPSALEPYGGAGTGLGGVIRDVLGTGLGARPIASTSAFGFGPPDLDTADVPEGALHPRRVIRGVVSGVRDYGNRMGIPTVSGAVAFDPRYTANPVVFCGTIGVLPRSAIEKAARPGDVCVVLGGRTGRDGIHGATFSSQELTSESEAVSSGAVQIGNPIEEKRVLEALLRMRDAGLLHAVTDCGAGGLSSAVGEMGAVLGAEVWLERVPLKYEGLTADEVWISEAQERMVLACAPGALAEVERIAREEGTEATAIGRFTGDGRLSVRFGDVVLVDLAMDFLHDGLPTVERLARFERAAAPEPEAPPREARAEPALARGTGAASTPGEALLAILSSWSACSREPILRQYDHEVQGTSVLKPYLGVEGDGPGDAAVLVCDPAEAGGLLAPDTPVLGVATACGWNPCYERDPYRMAALAVDEAIRNVVAVGADPDRVALLDNFTWGDCSLPDRLGSLVVACEGAKDAAIGFRAPFVSGKDSLNNELRHPDGTRTAVPPTLLVSALAIHPDVRRATSTDLAQPGGLLALCGATRRELGGSHLHRVRGVACGADDAIPAVDPTAALALYRGLFGAIHRGLVRACHDLSEGGLAVAAAEMAIGGRLGATLDLDAALAAAPALCAEALLFSESASRFLCEVDPANADAFAACLPPCACTWVGQVAAEPRLRARAGGVDLYDVALEDAVRAFRAPLARILGA